MALMIFCTVAAARGVINLGVSEATTLKYKTPVDTVFVANPGVADYQVVKGNQLIIFGKAVGSSSLIVIDSDGNTIDTRMLVVNKNLANIRQQLQLRFPDQTIEVFNLGDQVVLTGTVPSEQKKQDIYYLVGELLNKEVEKEKLTWETDGRTFDLRFIEKREYRGVVNNIEVAEVKQVNVKITIAEVSHSFIRQLGFKWGTQSGDSFITGEFFDLLGQISSTDIARYIYAADDDTMGQVLAEPNLSVISGETASFLAGGEVPIVTYIDDAYNVTYKEFGIRLQLAAEVLEDDKINIAMEPEVSAIDISYGNNQLNIPSFKTRRARTTVQLGDGESFVLGGLLSSEDREALSKIPMIGDIPVLGALFRYSKNERIKSELIIVATVNLVKPVPPGIIKLPEMSRTNSLLRFFHVENQAVVPVRDKTRLILSTGGFKQ
ncbi:type II and III secretion system protein family protein [Endozoicomonas sp.]|uniref:type II and III secretion system protein family protein n=1 Tax=Endozoicomonas sp. TaxID=1892382 RepID=UPI002883D603|nr:type II and III secretion system protein family protein [Endozoicomonas sp.]